jgi:hypothetical protein
VPNLFESTCETWYGHTLPKNNTRCLPNTLFDYMLTSLPVIAPNFPLYRD